MRKLWHAAVTALLAFDWPLLILLGVMAVLGLTVMQSAVGIDDPRFAEQYRNFIIAFFLRRGVALVPIAWVQRGAVGIYLVAVAFLPGVDVFSETSNGAQRWVNWGVVRMQRLES